MLAPSYIRFAVVLLAILQFLPGPAAGLTVTPGEVLFKVRTVSQKPSLLLSKLPGIRNITPLRPATRLSKPSTHAQNIYKADILQGYSIDTVIEILQNRADIEYAQPNHIFQTFQTTNDPLLSQQFYLDLIHWLDRQIARQAEGRGCRHHRLRNRLPARGPRSQDLDE